MSEYLSLSITGQGGQTRIRITTTDAHPVSYIAILPGAVMADLASLQFIAQSDDS
ncbi:hypothetical protein IVG45_11725 [Methylomonas sp. LL1]|uniref:hypothetical protein n=1 Tax=Methylomonas sp. LL1 TaxID=2785785 RepID=UPI0018C43E0B|nr:hypothetical protein [Methylomonas sp. LL1]QPK61568.1 hypothetical protein IVG45_11725 [Methylomonas sp. LL1]